MIGIADTSPLNYLIRIGHIDVLPQVYDRIVIPPSVQAELNHPQAPEMVSQWIAQPAEWLVRVRTWRFSKPDWDPLNGRLFFSS
jgi:predicted nucleic acid-binding protein